MALITLDDDTPRITYTVGVTPQTAFTVPFAFFEEGDLYVYVDDVLKTLTTDYVTSGAGDAAGGFVTFNTGQSSCTVVITRTLAYERTSSFPTGGPLDIEALNVELTRFTAMFQQLEDSFSRVLSLPNSDATVSIELPTKTARASKFLGFDSNGDPVASSSVTGVTVSAFMETVLDDTSASAARTTLGITDQAAAIGAVSHIFFD